MSVDPASFDAAWTRTQDAADFRWVGAACQHLVSDGETYIFDDQREGAWLQSDTAFDRGVIR